MVPVIDVYGRAKKVGMRSMKEWMRGGRLRRRFEVCGDVVRGRKRGTSGCIESLL